MLRITLDAEDRFSLYTGVGSNDVPMPTRTIQRDDFPTCGEDVIGQPVNIIYGDSAAVGQSTSLDAPLWVEDWAKGLVWEGQFDVSDDGRAGVGVDRWIANRGDMPGSTDAPTNIAISDDAGGTIDMGDIVWVNRLYAMAYCVDPAGVASETFPYWAPSYQMGVYTGLTAYYDNFSADNREMNVQITWPAAAGAGWTAKVFLGHNYYGLRWMQVISISHPTDTATFDAYGTVPLAYWGEWPLSTGAAWTYNGVQSPGAWFVVRAYNGSGESPSSLPIVVGGSYPYKRPVYLQWSAVAGATGYRIYQLSNADLVTPVRYWDVGNVTETHSVYTEGDGGIAVDPETPSRGIPVTYVGKLTDLSGVEWDAHLVCGHACKAVTAAYLDGTAISSTDYGVNLMVPGQTGYAAAFGDVYRDIGGRRYTLIYTRGGLSESVLEDLQVLSVDVQGVEDVGDGTGTLISGIFDQYAHWLEQWVLNAYQTGNWTSSPTTWGDVPYDVAILDLSTFAAAQTISERRLDGGYTGMTVIGADGPSTVRAWIARWNQSADVYCGFSRKSQYAVFMIDDDPTTADTAPVFAADTGIVADSFRTEDDVSALENQITAQYRRDFVRQDWRAALVAEDVDVQSTIGEVKPYTLELWCVTDPAQAWDIAARRLQRRKYPYRTVTWTSDMGGLTLDLGDLVKVTHPDGVGSGGWTERPCFVVRHEFDPTQFVVTISAIDLDFAFEPVLSAAEEVLLSAFADEQCWIGARVMLGG